MRKLLRIFVFFSPLLSMAQQDPQFSQYMMNPYIWNPSVPAAKNEYIASLHYRTQWLGYTPSNSSDNIQPPTTQLFTFTAPIQKLNSGVGLSLMNDNIGPIRNQNVIVSYAYGINVASGRLAAGIGLGLQSISINTNLWRPENPNDITLSSVSGGSLNQFKPNYRYGISFTNEKIFLGISSDNVFNPTYTFSSGQFKSQLERHYYVQGSYKIFLSDRISLQPSALFKNVSKVSSLEISNLILLGNLWTGLGYRTSDAVTFFAGINLFPDKSLKIGYNLDLSVINKNAKSLTSHEIFLSYNIASILDNRKPIVRSPRFR